MTYRSRGRSIFEVILAVCFVGFLVGFITVLCIGNYFRAKRAQERQRQRRLAKLANSASNGGRSSRSNATGNSMSRPDQGYAPSIGGDTNTSNGGGYEAPHMPANASNGVRA